MRSLLLLALLTVLTGSAPASGPLYDGMTVREVFIPMHDGTRLAVNLFFPTGLAPTARLPIILEYLPYRKDDWALERDYTNYSYFVRRGFIGARLDVRGTGRSEGRLPDREYSDQELEDGDEAIAWLARQPWSNGNVGMMGISWGGFNSIMMAMRRPPALKAIIEVDATDELFLDDVHYWDGIFHYDEFELSMDLQTMLTRPPDFPIDERALHDRFDVAPWSLLYFEHQRDGPFWRRASLRPQYDRITIPVFAVGGFYDGYRDSIPRMLEAMHTPVRALVGPWNHTYPDEADPGPAIEWRADAVRWWNRWLRGEHNGIEAEPRLTVFMRDAYPPGLDRHTIPGHWAALDGWPPADSDWNGARRSLDFSFGSNGSLSAFAANGAQGLADKRELRYVPSIGNEVGFWWGELTVDQRPLDGMGLTFDGPPLSEPLSILGRPSADLTVSASAPLADWFVRLEDVAPDGSATLITGSGFAGAQRDSHTAPTPLTPGKTYHLAIPLHFTSWVFPAGHRVRVSVTNALWPLFWPTPFAMTTSLNTGSIGEEGSSVHLPIAPPDMKAVTFAPVTEKPLVLAGVSSTGDDWPGEYRVYRDVPRALTEVQWGSRYTQTFPWGSEASREHIVYRQADCCSAVSRVTGTASTTVRLKGRTLVFSIAHDLHSDAHTFYYSCIRTLTQNGITIRKREWRAAIPRDHQ